MGFNPDGTPDNGGNFTQQGGSGPAPGGGSTPYSDMGVGDHGEHWNPNGNPDGTGRWEGGTGNAPGGTGGRPQEGARGVGNMGAGGGYNPRTGIADFGEGAETGNIQDPTAWGGVSGKIIIGPDGKPMVDPSQDGRGQDVSRFRGVADAAAHRAAPKMDYSKGDADRARSLNTRGDQGVATSMLADAAHGGAPSGAVIRGQGATDDSFATALTAGGGVKGGPTNQAAANAAGANAAGVQQGGVAAHLGQARGGELTSARTAYSQGTAAQRAGDYAQQGTDLQRQRAGLANEMGQRELNQGRELGYEGLAYDTNVGAMNAGLKEGDRHAGLVGSSLQRETQQSDRMAGFYNKAIGEAGKMGGSALHPDDDK